MVNELSATLYTLFLQQQKCLLWC